MSRIFNVVKKTLSNVFLFDVLIDRSSWPAFAWAGTWILIGTLVYHYVEQWSWLDSLYFCVVTLATVGYGDFTPSTPFAKIFTIFYILNGIGILLLFLNKVTDIRRERGVQVIQSRKAQSVQQENAE